MKLYKREDYYVRLLKVIEEMKYEFESNSIWIKNIL